MVNWTSPVTISRQYFGFVRLCHCLGGVYFWEFATSLGSDRLLITRRRKGGRTWWVKWVYLCARYFALATFVTVIIGFDITTPINCKAVTLIAYLWGFLGIECASALIGIRVIAIWNKKTTVSIIVAIALIAQLAAFTRQLILVEATWVNLLSLCSVYHTERNRVHITVTLIVDTLLLVLMLVGLLRWREARALGLWNLLWKQGLLWITLAWLVEVPSTIFVWLDLNEAMNVMFFPSELLVLVIAATRMYRSLSDFGDSHSSASDSFTTSHTSPRIPQHRRAQSPFEDAILSHPPLAYHDRQVKTWDARIHVSHDYESKAGA